MLSEILKVISWWRKKIKTLKNTKDTLKWKIN